jgi:hypothetical protein
MNQQRDNSGVLFRNDDKKSEKSPDYTGSAMIDGVEKRLAAWIKEGRKGKFMSLSFSEPKERATPESAERVKAEKGFDDDLDGIPF